MTVISIILGIILVFGGISSICTPFLTFLAAGYFIGILMLVYGVVGIVRAFQKMAGAFETIMSILAVIVGIFAMIRPGSTLLIDVMLLYFVAFWFTLRGVLAIVMAFQVKSVSKSWFWWLILGILFLVLGCYSFVHPAVPALATGLLIGFYFVETGIDMIVRALTLSSIKKAATEAKREAVIDTARELKKEAAKETAEETES